MHFRLRSFQYEMTLAHIKNQIFNHGAGTNMIEHVLKLAMDYVNKSSGMQLSFNYPFTAHKTIEPCNQWIDVDDVLVFENKNITICVSDDECDELDDPNHLVDIHQNECTEIRFVSNEKLHLASDSVISGFPVEKIAPFIFYSWFPGTKILSNEVNEKDSVKCPLCTTIVDPKTLNAHFNCCDRFHV